MPILAVAPHWGAWIEIFPVMVMVVIGSVAPHWGAWIEIGCGALMSGGRASHPTGVRGLKFLSLPRGEPFFKSHPTGVRGLKYANNYSRHAEQLRRTPLGCVD